MRVAISLSIITTTMGGLRNSWVNIIKTLQEIDNENEYFIFCIQKHHNFFIKTNENFHFIESRNFIFHPVINILWHFFVFPFLLIKYHIDIAHIPDARRIPLFKPATLFLGVLHIFEHVLPNRHKNPLRNLYAKIFNKFFVKKADAIWTVSFSSRRDIVKHIGFKEENIYVVPNGVEQIYPRPLERIKKTLRKYKVNNNYILCVNRLEHPLKNHVTLVQAYSLLKKRRKNELKHKMIFIGEVKGQKSLTARSHVVLDLIKECKLENDIVLLGFMENDDLFNFYAGADLFVCPSLYEGFGLTPVEAMSAKVPTIASNNSSLAEIVGGAGLLFDTLNAKDLSEKMELVLFDKGYAAELANKCFERSKEYTLDSMALNTKAAYESIYKNLVIKENS